MAAWQSRFILRLAVFLGVNLALLMTDIWLTGVVTWSRWPLMAGSFLMMLDWLAGPRPRRRRGMLQGLLVAWSR